MNDSSNFDTVDYDALINTKIDYSFNHVFNSKTIQELDSIRYIYELERTLLLIVFLMSDQNSHSVVTFFPGTAVTFSLYKALLLSYTNFLILFYLCMKLMGVLIVYQHNVEIL